MNEKIMDTIFYILIIGIIIGTALYNFIKNYKEKKKIRERNLQKLRIAVAKIKMEDQDISNIIQTDEKSFLKERFDDYCTIQNAWMNFDYDTLRKYVTDELYNQYEMQLQTLKRKNEQNIMYDYARTYSKIIGLDQDEKKTTITIEMEINLKDYIVNKDKKVVRGDSSRTLHNDYIMSFTKNNHSIENCPNCNAPLNGNHKCPNCNNIIPETENWVLSKKQII